MNAPVLLAQLVGNSSQPNNPPRNIKLEKPQNGGAVTVRLDGHTQLDFSDVASEKLTFVRVGDKLIVLFDNQSTVTVDPVFGSDGHPLASIAFEMGPDRTLSGDQFASLFPITTDQSVLPAAGPGGNGPTAGAHFGDPAVDPLSIGTPLDLLGPEDFGGAFRAIDGQGAANTVPTAGANATIVLNEDAIPGAHGNPGGVGDVNAPFSATGVLSHNFQANGPGFIEFAAMNGTSQIINGIVVTFTWNAATNTLTGNDGAHNVFQLVLTDPVNGNFTVTLEHALLHHTDASGDNVEGNNTFVLSYTVHDSNGDTIGGTVDLTINDDTPVATNSAPGSTNEQGQFVAALPLDDATSNTHFGNSSGNGDGNGDHVANNITSGFLQFSPGADGLKDVTFASLNNTAATFKAIYDAGNGVAGQESVTYHWTEATHTLTAIGDTSGNVVFTLQIDDTATGHFTFELDSALVHSNGEETANLSLVLPFTVTDGDGDQNTANLAISVSDDNPVAQVVTAPTTLDDDAQTLFPGNAGGAGDVSDATAINGGAGTLFSAGADGLASISFTEPSGLQAIYKLPNGLAGQETLHYSTTVDSNGDTILTATGDQSHHTVFTLTVSPDGSYNFVVDEPLVQTAHDTSEGQPVEETQGVTIGFTVTDGDGDQTSGSLTVNVNDDTPVAQAVTAPVTLNDDAQTLFPGNPGGVGDVANATSVGGAAGALFSAGADGLASINFSDPSDLKAIYKLPNGLAAQETLHYSTTVDSNGDTILTATGDQSHHTVFTLTVGPDGSYNFVVDEPLVQTAHDTSEGQPVEETQGVTIGFTVTDGDGDQTSGSLTVNVNDDTPVIKTVDGQPASIVLTDNENDIRTPWSVGTSPSDGNADGSLTESSTGAAIVSGSLSSIVSAGADGLASYGFSSTAINYFESLHLFSKQTALPENGLELTYTITHSGNDIILTASEPDTHGPGNTGNPVFSFTLNQQTGDFTFRLFDELIHVAPGTPGADSDFDLRSGDLVGGVQQFISGLDFGHIITVTDGDGDTITLDNSVLIRIHDDAPTADIGLRNESVTIDETPGLQKDDTSSSGVKAIFAGVVNPGDDPDVSGTGAINYARSDSPVVTNNSNIGADAPALGQHFTLAIVGNGDSGLKLTDGTTIHLTIDGSGRILGVVDTDSVNPGFSGKTAFAVAIDDNGFVSVAQYLSLQNPTGGSSYDETVSLAGKVSAVLTVTDSDGDKSTDSVNIGSKIAFADDGPSVNVDRAQDSHHDDASLATQTLDESIGHSNSDPNAASDDTGVTSVSLLTVADPNKAIGIVSTPDSHHSGTSIADLFTVSIDGGADGVSAKDISNVYSLALTDSHGHAIISQQGGESATAVKTSLVVTELADTALQGTTDAQRTIYLFKEADGSIVGKIGSSAADAAHGDVAIRIELSGSSSDPQLTVEQYLPIEHGNTGSLDDAAILKLIGDGSSLGVTLTTTVTDGDGDIATDSKTVTIADDNSSIIKIEDDGPTVSISATSLNVVQDETPGVQNTADPHAQNDVPGSALPSGVLALFDGVANRGVDSSVSNTLKDHNALGFATSTGSLVNVSADFGTDGHAINHGQVLSLAISGGNGADSGLKTTDGHEIFLFLENGLIVGRYDGSDNGNGVTNSANHGSSIDPAAFAIAIGQDGSASIAQYVSLWNPTPGASYDETAVGLKNVLATVTVTDGDGDQATSSVNISSHIQFQDDGPTLSVTTPAAIHGLDFGSFELNGDAWGTGSGTATDSTGSWTISNSADGQGGSGAVHLERVGDGYQGMHSSTNGFMVDLDATPHDVQISQTLSGLVAHQTYDLRFEAGAPFPDSAHVEVWFGGQLVFSLSPTSQMQEYEVSLTGGSGDGSNLLEFRETGVADNQGTYLANISVGEIVIDETPGIDPGSNETTSSAVEHLFTALAAHHIGADPDMPVQYAVGTGPVVTVMANFGADGPAGGSAATGTVYSLATMTGTDSGLATTAGKEIFLFNETHDGDSYVVGRYDSTGNGTVNSNDDAAFAFRIDPTTGALAVVQYVSLHQPDTSSNNEGVFLNANSLSVSVTVTDGDGDTATKQADISTEIRFDDDGPHAAIALSGTTLTIDETAGADAGTNDVADFATNAALTALFTSIGGTPIEIAQSHAAVVSSAGSAAGADGGTMTFGLSVSAPAGVDSGLDATDGRSVFLFKEGDLVVGREGATDGTADAEGAVAFAISLDSSTGVLSVAQYIALHENDPTNPNDSVSLLNNVIQASVTVTDGDGDTSVASVGIGGQIHFLDDGPTVAAAPLNQIVNGDFTQGVWSAPDWWGSASTDVTGWTLGQSPVGGGTVDLERLSDGYLNMHSSTGGFMVDMGSSPGNIGLTQSFAGPSALVAGQTYAIQFEAGAPFPETAKLEVMWDGQVIGTIDPSGPGLMTSYNYVVTANGTSGDVLTLVEIGTGNAPVSGTWEGHDLQTEDYHGTYLANIKLVAVNAVVDEDGLPAGNHDLPTPSEGDAPGIATSATGSLGINWGADNYDPGTDSVGAQGQFTQDHSGTALTGRNVVFTDATVGVSGAEGLTSKGDHVDISLTDSGTRLVGTATDAHGVTREVFEVSLSDDGTGQFNFILKDSLDHAPNGSENDLDLTFNFTATDSDGDTAHGSFTVAVDDDVPVIGAVASGVVDEDGGLPGGNLFGPGDTLLAGTTSSHSLNISWGADDNNTGATNNRSVSFAADLVAPAGLTSDGVQLVYSFNADHTVLTAMAGNTTVFTVTLDDSSQGSYTFQLLGNLDHPVAGTEDNLTLSFGFVARDSDGDPASSSFDVKVNDDTPVIVLPISGVVNEDSLAGGNPGGNGNIPFTTATSTHTLGILWGADSANSAVDGGFSGTQVNGDRSVAFAAGVADALTALHLHSNGTELSYAVSPDRTLLTASADGHSVFTVSLSDNNFGSYTFTLLDNLDHPAGQHENNITIDFGFTARDSDGDPTSSSFSITINDDTPVTTGTPVAGNVSETNLPNVAVDAHSLNISFGADGHSGHVTFTLDSQGNPIVPAGLTSDGVTLAYTVQTLSSGEQQLVAYKSTETADHPVFIVTLNSPVNPTYIFTLYHDLDNGPAHDTTLPLTFTVNATDGDGDTVQQNFTVNLQDSVPVITGSASAGNVSEANLPSDRNPNGHTQVDEESLHISWGADSQNAHLSFATDGDGHVIAPQGLTSDGISLSYELQTLSSGEQQIVAYKSTETADNPVFIVTLNSPVNPTYIFTLLQNVDHDPAHDASLPLTFTVNATDGDGDTVQQSFTVNVADDVPVAQNIVGAITEDQARTFTLIEGTDFSFGADNHGTITLGTATFTDVPAGVVLNAPDVTLGSDGHSIIVASGFDALSEGASAILHIPYTVTDGDGDTVTKEVTVTVTGTNDGVATSEGFPDGGTMTEYAANDPQAESTIDRTRFNDNSSGGGYNGGGFWIYDADQADTHNVTVTPPAGAIGYITASVGEETVGDGVGFVNWNYHVTDAQLDFLAAGQTVTEVFQITVDDGHGASASRDITITLVGSEDAPHITVNGGDSDHVFLTETNAGLAATGTLTASDVDVTDVLTAKVVSVSASGSNIDSHFTDAQLLSFISLGANPVDSATTTSGAIQWSFNSGSEAFNFLPAGFESVIDYTIEVSDGQGGTDQHVVEIKIHGTNDAPVITIPGGESVSTHVAGFSGDEVVTRALTEHDTAHLTTSGTLTVSDIDSGDAVHATVKSVTGGGAGYNAQDALGFLTLGSSTVIDGTHTSPEALNWTFDTDNQTFGFLPAGFQVVLNYTVEVTDSHGATADQVISVLITGTNEAPVITIPGGESVSTHVAGFSGDEVVTRALTEHDTAHLTTSGTLTVSDIDSGDVVHATVKSVTGGGGGYNAQDALGFLTLGSSTVIDGTHTSPEALNWTFDTDNQTFGFLPAGFQVVLNYTVEVTDSHGATADQVISVLITGTNEAPVITIPGGESVSTHVAGFSGDEVVTRALTEHDTAHLTTSGTLTVSDIDSGDVVHATVKSVTGGGGGYNAQDALGFLTLGSSTVIDGTHTSPEALNWTFDTDNQTFGFLPAGFQVVLNYTVEVTDSHGATADQVISVLITGTNEAPVIGTTSVVSGSVTEAGDLPGVDQASFGNAFHLAPALGAQVAGNSAVTSELAGLATHPSDVHTTLLTIENQLHVNEATAIAIVWDNLNTTYVTAGANQGNINQAFVYLGIEYAAYLKSGGTPLVDVVAKYTTDGNNDGIPDRDQSLHDNLLGNLTTAALTQHFASDPNLIATLSTAISNVDTDLLARPYASGNEGDAGNVDAHAFDAAHGFVTTAIGTLVATDIDHGTTLTWSIDAQPISGPSYGIMAIDATGHWTYTLDNSLATTQALAQGDTVHETFVATVTDEHGATDTVNVTVTIDGTNDAPVAAADSQALTDASGTDAGHAIAGIASVLANDHDVDMGDTLHVSGIEPAGGSGLSAVSGSNATLAHGTYGDLSIFTDGHYTYTPNVIYDALQAGDHEADVFTYQVTDASGASASASLTISIDGANDSPVAVADTQTLTETSGTDAGHTITGAASVLANDHDVDTGDTLHVSGIEASGATDFTTVSGSNATLVHGTYGDLSIFADGHYTYAPNVTYDALQTGEHGTDVFTYQVTDAGGLSAAADLTFNITGTSDAPPNVPPTPAADHIFTNITTGNAVLIPVAGLLWNDVDPDSTLSIDHLNGASYSDNTHQFITINAPALNGDVTFSYTVTDGVNPESAATTVTLSHVGTLTATSGSDFLIDGGAAGINFVGAGGGDVLVKLTGGGTNIFGDTQFSPDLGTDSGNDLLFGTTSPDQLFGGKGNDTLYGGASADLLYGGVGNDTLIGATGADTFIFADQGAASLDLIFDFSNAEGDKIDISALLGANATAADANIGNYVNFAVNGSDLVLQVDTSGQGAFTGGGHDVATLAGYDAGNQHIVNVVFAGHDHQVHV